MIGPGLPQPEELIDRDDWQWAWDEITDMHLDHGGGGHADADVVTQRKRPDWPFTGASVASPSYLHGRASDALARRSTD